MFASDSLPETQFYQYFPFDLKMVSSIPLTVLEPPLIEQSFLIPTILQYRDEVTRKNRGCYQPDRLALCLNQADYKFDYARYQSLERMINHYIKINGGLHAFVAITQTMGLQNMALLFNSSVSPLIQPYSALLLNLNQNALPHV